jgi:hypothetical protein
VGFRQPGVAPPGSTVACWATHVGHSLCRHVAEPRTVTARGEGSARMPKRGRLQFFVDLDDPFRRSDESKGQKSMFR